MASYEAIIVQDGGGTNTVFLRSTYAGTTKDKGWFEAAIGSLAGGGGNPNTGGRIFVLPNESHSNQYFSNFNASEFIDVSATTGVDIDNVEVICTPGTEFKYNPAVGTATGWIKIVGQSNWVWRGGTFIKQGANVSSNESIFAVSNTGGTNSNNFEIRDVKFQIACTDDAMVNFSCVRLQGDPSATNVVGAMRRPKVIGCDMEVTSAQVQQATAFSAQIGSSEFYTNTHGARLLLSDHTHGLQFADCHAWGIETSDSNYFGGLAEIGQDEGGHYSNLSVQGLSTVAADGTAGDVIRVGTWKASHGEGSHYILKDLQYHGVGCRYGVVSLGTLYARAHSFNLGRMGCKAAVFLDRNPEDNGTGKSLVLDDMEFHNVNPGVQDNSGSGSFGQTLGGHLGDHIRAQYTEGFSIGQLSAVVFQNPRAIVRIGRGAFNYLFDPVMWTVIHKDGSPLPHPVVIDEGAGAPAPRYTRTPGYGGRRYEPR